jgi:hypothetical protein
MLVVVQPSRRLTAKLNCEEILKPFGFPLKQGDGVADSSGGIF